MVNWFSSVKSFFGRNLSTKSDPTYAITAQFYSPGQPIWSNRNYHAFVQEGYKKCGAVYACVNKIAQNAAGIKWKLYTDESMKREITSHPLLDLWKRPNPRMGTPELIEQIFGFWHLAGNGYLYASRLNPNEPPVELWPLFSDQVKIVAGQYDIAGYVYGYGGPNPRVFELDDIMHLKFASYDERSLYGLSPIEVSMRTVDRLNAGNEWNMALMQNYGAPSALFTSKGYLTVEQRNQIKSELKKKFSGKRNAGMPMVLEADMSYQQMAINPKELDWLTSRGFDERGICMILDVPSILLSDYEGQTYANRKEAKQSLFTENVLPKMDRVVGHVNMWLVPMYEDLRKSGAYFTYDKKDIEVLAELYSAVEQQLDNKATNGWNNGLWDLWTSQEMQGIKPDPNGKGIYKLGPTTLVRSEDLQAYAMACLEKLNAPPPMPLLNQPPHAQPAALPAPKPGTTTVTEVPPDDGKTPLQGQNGKRRHIEPAIKVLDLSTKEEKAAYLEQVEQRREKWQSEIEQRLQDYFKDERKSVVKAVKGCSTTDSEMSDAVQTALSDQHDELQQQIYNIWHDVGQDFYNETARQLAEADKAYNPLQGKKDAIQDFIDIFGTDLLTYLLTVAGKKITQINDTTLAEIQSELHDGVVAGESIPEIAKRIGNLYLQEIIPNRSTVIARTEIIGASNWSSHEAATKSGLELEHVWLATEDNKTRPAHAEADGQTVPLGQKFTVGGEELAYPGDPSGSAENVIQCRCTEYYQRVKSNASDQGSDNSDNEKMTRLSRPREFRSVREFMGVLV